MIKTKKSPLFSIITVCYNEEKTIEKTCKSIASQKYKNFEWRVIDGKSTDKTLEIIKKYKKHTTSLSSEKDSGIYNAMNKGIKKSKGKYLLFLNGGDYLKNENTLQEVSAFIEKDGHKNDLYYGDMLYDNGELVSYKNSTLNEKFFAKKSISHQATFIKKDLFFKYGDYNEKYRIVSDFEFWIKSIIKGKIKTKYLPVVVSVFDQSGMSTDYKLAKKQIDERNDVLLKYNLISKRAAHISRIKWFILMILKRTGLYGHLRKGYRGLVKR
jgi:glycosyltransferase involved in cell wall biosynthesis